MKLEKFTIIVAACSAADDTRDSFISHAKYHLKKPALKLVYVAVILADNDSKIYQYFTDLLS